MANGLPKRKSYLYFKGDYLHHLEVNNFKGNLLVKRLDASFGVMATALAQVNRLFAQQVCLSLPLSWNSPYDNSQVIERFIRKLKQLWAKDSKKRGKLFYAWCRESKKSHNPHWHLAVFVDDKYTKYGFLSDLISCAWKYAISLSSIDGLIHWSGFKRVVKSDVTGLSDLFKWVSYLSKHQEGTVVTHGQFRTSRVDNVATQLLMDKLNKHHAETLETAA